MMMFVTVFMFLMVMAAVSVFAYVDFESRYPRAYALCYGQFPILQGYSGQQAAEVERWVEPRRYICRRSQKHVAGYSGARVEKYDPATRF
jgi:hypothetical protein